MRTVSCCNFRWCICVHSYMGHPRFLPARKLMRPSRKMSTPFLFVLCSPGEVCWLALLHLLLLFFVFRHFPLVILQEYRGSVQRLVTNYHHEYNTFLFVFASGMPGPMVWFVRAERACVSRLKWVFRLIDGPLCGDVHIAVYLHVGFRFHTMGLEPRR